eukprot:1160202-Pelagomonas_calceolata.AAC.11
MSSISRPGVATTTCKGKGNEGCLLAKKRQARAQAPWGVISNHIFIVEMRRIWERQLADVRMLQGSPESRDTFVQSNVVGTMHSMPRQKARGLTAIDSRDRERERTPRERGHA